MKSIFYLCPDYKSPVGGVRVMYRHVDILNRNGLNALILHRHKGFRCEWFKNITPITYIGKVKLKETDFLVIPEIYGSLYIEPSSRPKAAKYFNRVFNNDLKKIVFNQNTYNTFSGHGFNTDITRSIYNHKDVIGAMVVSEDNREYLEFSFPLLKTARIHNCINSELFKYTETKKNQICFMPRKNHEHALQVISMLKGKDIIQGFDIMPIEGKSETETAEILRESMFFLSFGYPEGFSLPPAEAMSCGCIVIGYHGMGGREYFNSDFCFPVEMGDILGFAKTVQAVLKIHSEKPALIDEMRKRASEFIQTTYSAQREENDLMSFWRAVL